MQFGETVRRLREAAGISQAAVAERMGVRRDELCRMETGERPMGEPEYLSARTAIVYIRSERDAAYEAALSEVAS